MEWTSTFANNSIFVLSASRTGEVGVARRLVEDLEQIRIATHAVRIEHHNIATQRELVSCLQYIARAAKKGVRPILHLDMHGDDRRGLEIPASREFATWRDVNSWLQKINISSKNNLCVVVAACFGLNLVAPISVIQPAPFYCLIASRYSFDLGYFEQNMIPFYRVLLQQGSLQNAIQEIDEHFELFHCEKILAITLARYIKTACKGSALKGRTEGLISEALAAGIPRSKQSLKLLRQFFRANLQPSDALVRRYAERFLIGKSFSVSLEEIMRLVDQPQEYSPARHYGVSPT